MECFHTTFQLYFSIVSRFSTSNCPDKSPASWIPQKGIRAHTRQSMSMDYAGGLGPNAKPVTFHRIEWRRDRSPKDRSPVPKGPEARSKTEVDPVRRRSPTEPERQSETAARGFSSCSLSPNQGRSQPGARHVPTVVDKGFTEIISGNCLVRWRYLGLRYRLQHIAPSTGPSSIHYLCPTFQIHQPWE